jgi:hypothetical protein
MVGLNADVELRRLKGELRRGRLTVAMGLKCILFSALTGGGARMGVDAAGGVREGKALGFAHGQEGCAAGVAWTPRVRRLKAELQRSSLKAEHQQDANGVQA